MYVENLDKALVNDDDGDEYFFKFVFVQFWMVMIGRKERWCLFFSKMGRSDVNV